MFGGTSSSQRQFGAYLANKEQGQFPSMEASSAIKSEIRSVKCEAEFYNS